ncbi:MAG: methyl-accepting chemotaxis protein [Gammaproteobacteria bacterium]|nr:methyl-accepting chemotaxis protein [Gammaproteobacteria bacterium]
MNALQHMSIRARLVVLVTFAVLGLIAVQAFTLVQGRGQLMSEKELQTRALVEVANGVLAHYHGLFAQGLLSAAEARRSAAEVIAAMRHSGQEYFWINDMNGVMVMHPFKPELNGKSVTDLRDPAGKYMFREFVDTARRGGSGTVAYQWPKPGQTKPEPKVSYVAQFVPWGWVVGTGIYVSDVHETFLSNVATGVLRLGAVSALLVLLSLVIIHSILRPLSRTTAAMEDIASGEGDLTCRLHAEGKDELTALARAFNHFVQKVQDVMRQVGDATLHLASSAEQLSASVQETRAAVRRQQGETDQVATAMNEMAATVKEVARSASDTAHSAQEADGTAIEGSRLVREARGAIAALSSEIDATTGAVTTLEQEVENIGSVLDVIRGIAEQTNLLALNAAIEAARAGEQGRGFAVVADEVRTLAARTQDATQEIRDMIDALRTGAQHAVEAMGASRGLTAQTVEKAEAAARALDDIVPTVARISDMSAQIASATQEQEAVAKEIDRNVTEIAGGAEQSAAATEEVTRASASLAKLSEELRALVHQFKY